MALEFWNLSGKKILIVDDFADMRSLVRNMLIAFDPAEIVQAKNGEVAIEKLQEQRFDIVLCDYNLGEGKDGQQVLEEAKHRNLLSFSSVFIMITAENTTAMVLGALEYVPDSYLSKPFTKTVLQARLKKILEKKKSLKGISDALDKNDNAGALTLIDKELDNDSKYRFELSKLKCDILIEMQNYDAAEALSKQILEEREMPWATQCLGIVNYYKEQYEDAKGFFEKVLEQNNTYIAAYDWLAKTQEALKDTKASQTTLLRAIEKSPKSVNRQRALGDIAQKNNDKETLEKARKQTLKVGHNSILVKPNDFVSYSKILIDKNDTKEALKIAESMKYTFKGNQEAQLESTILQGTIHIKDGNASKGEQLLKKALSQLPDDVSAINSDLLGDLATSCKDTNINDMPVDAALNIAKACLKEGRTEEGNKIIKQIVRNHHDDQTILDKVAQLYKELGLQKEGGKIISDTKSETIEINNKGVQLLKKGKYQESIELFLKAVESMPQNYIINLNAAYSLILFMKDKGVDKQKMQKAKSYLDVAQSSEPHKSKYDEIMTMYNQMSA